MLAELFNITLVSFDADAETIAEWPAGRAGVLERAVLEASGLFNEDDADTIGGNDPTPEDDSPAEHSVMAGPAANERAGESLDEMTEADLVYQLHQQGYTFREASGLLIPEIDLLMDGVERANRRQEKEQEKSESSQQSAGTGGMKGNRGGAHGNALW